MYSSTAALKFVTQTDEKRSGKEEDCTFFSKIYVFITYLGSGEEAKEEGRGERINDWNDCIISSSAFPSAAHK